MIHIGTSGWQYDDWRGDFYPQELPKKDWLVFFSERFPLVEVNNTFYNLPAEETFVKWRATVGEDFVFVVKASRYITHIRRLRNCEEAIERFWTRARGLGPKLGPVLFQLPPNLQADLDLLEEFLRLLPPRMRAAFEFRHDSWKDEDVHRALDKAGCALVLADRPGWRIEDVVTAGWSYIRFHQGTMLTSGYRRSKLRRWADRMAALPAEETYVFFNNDPGGAAVRDARTLTALLAERGARVNGPRG